MATLPITHRRNALKKIVTYCRKKIITETSTTHGVIFVECYISLGGIIKKKKRHNTLTSSVVIRDKEETEYKKDAMNILGNEINKLIEMQKRYIDNMHREWG